MMERDRDTEDLHHIQLEIFNSPIRNGFNFPETALYVGCDNIQMYSLVEIFLKYINGIVKSI